MACVLAALLLTACSKPLTPEEAKNSVLQGERDRLPLMLQRISTMGVNDITIDSLVLLTNDEPMQGMLYTTWTSTEKNYYSGKSKTVKTPVIIPVDSIVNSQTKKGYVQWQSDWESAFRTYIAKRIFN